MNGQTYFVTAFGIAQFERKVLGRIFTLSNTRPYTYAFTPPERNAPHILLVDANDRAAVAQWHAARAQPLYAQAPTVVVSTYRPARGRYYALRPFMATRLLEVLDEVVANELAPTLAPGTTIDQLTDTADSGEPHPSRADKNSTKQSDATEDASYLALVVDDSNSVRTQIGSVLRRADIDAEFAPSGDRALELIDEKTFDIIFLDVMMPGRNGYDVCKTIKRDRQRKHIPVVMLTGRSSPFDKVKGRLSGCNTYLTKPVSRKAFDETLRKYLVAPFAHD
ncbi:MAG: response regulator [Gammaproteobacteria bacterium]|nr:response regulator [Gammaproteobacteria bacterium]